jgi:hypothetical protein
MFLDSAQLRDSVISHAKELNYLPSSRSSARAVVDITLNTSGNPTFVIVPAKTKFRAICGSDTYTFHTKESVTITPSNGEYRFNNLDIHEGEYITELFDPSATTNQRYLISNENVDIESLEVRIIENDFSEEYIYSPDLYNRVSTDKSFFLQAHTGNAYEIFFGNDVYGVEPKAGSIIEVTYRTTTGEEGNGITSFEPAETIQGFAATISLRTASRGGAEREDLKSIRYFAPKAIQVQERAVVGKDYEILLKRSFPEVRTVAVYGGETLDPPQYGRIIISVALQDYSNISTNSRELYRQFLKERSALTVEPIVVPAEFAYFDIRTNITYNTKNTIKSSTDVKGLVQSAILDYSDGNLGDFKNTLRFSKLTAMIDDSEESILSNETDLRLILEITPVPDIPDNYSIRFGNSLFIQRDQEQLSTSVQSVETAVVSSVFTYQGQDAYLRDNGNGTLDILSNAGTTVQFLEKNVGTVNYETGLVGIDGFVVDSYLGDAIKFYGNIRTDDIKTPSEHVSFIRPEDITITITSVSE